MAQHGAVFICDNTIFHVSRHTATDCTSVKPFCLLSGKLIDGRTTSEETLRNSSRGSPSDDLCRTVHAALTATWLDQEWIAVYEAHVCILRRRWTQSERQQKVGLQKEEAFRMIATSYCVVNVSDVILSDSLPQNLEVMCGSYILILHKICGLDL